MRKLLIITMTLLFALDINAQSQGKAWSQTVFREVNLKDYPNTAVLGVRCQGVVKAVFEAAEKGAPVYKYDMNGHDILDGESQSTIDKIFADFHLTLQEIPYADITTLYVMEQTAYNATNSSFTTEVVAVCPVLLTQDDFGLGVTKYPICWVRLGDARQQLSQLITTPANNQQYYMSAYEWLSLQQYQGSIYKIQNNAGVALPQYCSTPEMISAEQQRIESGLRTIKKQTYQNHLSK